MTDLINRSTDGESAIKSAIKELKVNGYLHTHRGKDKSGRFNGTVWEYDDEPFTQTEQNEKNIGVIFHLWGYRIMENLLVES